MYWDGDVEKCNRFIVAMTGRTLRLRSVLDLLFIYSEYLDPIEQAADDLLFICLWFYYRLIFMPAVLAVR